MTSRLAERLAAAAMAGLGARVAGAAASLAIAVAGNLQRVTRALTAARERERAIARGWSGRRDEWRAAAQERYLGGAVDAFDLERRQRTWDRDESNAYSMSGWS